ncbi:MAG: glucosamine-6-phosphate deaminase [Clostridiales bacterium]|nr:MAG: glucosamine-6-phosphate deaminase [Clostridiales bacterium]
MRIEKFETYADMSVFIAELIASQLLLKPDSVLGLATGSTPLGAYEHLVRLYNAGKVDFSKCVTFNLDEYYPISPDNPQSYHYYMRKNLFDYVNVPEKNIHIPDGSCGNPEEECRRYDELVEQYGGIDLQLLGLGENGHIGFNEPASKLDNKTHLTALTESTIEANSRFFASADEVPRHALTMGVGTILKSKKIIIAISGNKKLNAFHKMLEGQIDTSSPATLLNLHNDVIVAFNE